MAKLIESKLKTFHPCFSGNPYVGPIPPQLFTPLKGPPPLCLPSPFQMPHLPIRLVTPAQYNERRVTILYYHCDGCFHPSHKCTQPKFMLLLCDENLPPALTLKDIPNFDISSNLIPDLTTPLESFHLLLSTQVMTGTLSPQALKFEGQLNGLPISFLIDTGSSHNIIQTKVDTDLHLPTVPYPLFGIIVGNGDPQKYGNSCK